MNKVVTLCLCGLFAALCAVLSWISIPFWPVPVAFTHISIFMAAGLLGPLYGTVSVAVFVALGAAGVPVFSGFSGGLGVIAGPRGGYIIGYILAAFVAGLIIEKFGIKIPVLILGMFAGWVCTYAAGLPWLMHVNGLTLGQVFVPGFAQFIPGDAAKTALCVFLIRRLYPLLNIKKRAA